jgi:uncharacterized repeat protein (TIGR01451 family)
MPGFVVWLIFTLVIVPSIFTFKASAAITEPLVVYSANPRYLASGGKPIVFIGAGRVYPGDIEGHLFEEYVSGYKYRDAIDFMAAHKANYGRIWHMQPWYSPNIRWPWARTGPGIANDGLPKYDLTKWDEQFWEEMRDACAYAASKDIFLEIDLWEECGMEADNSAPGTHRWSYHPFNPSNNINGLNLPSGSSGTVSGVPAFYNLSDSKLLSIQKLYVDKLLAETSSYPNVIYEICNEYTGPSDWENFWIEYVSARTSRLIAVNRLPSPLSSYWTNPAIKIVNFHWGTNSPTIINSNMNSYYSKNKVINYDEPPERPTTYTEYRQVVWSCFVGGGHVQLQNGYNAFEAWRAVRHLRNFIDNNDIPFWEMIPMNSLVTQSPGGTAFCFAKPGAHYVIYIVGSGGGSMTVNLEPGHTYRAKVYRDDETYVNLTVNGNTVSGIPSYSSDTVVYIRATDVPDTNTPNVKLTLTVDKATLNPGDVITCTVTYQNVGKSDAISVVITAPIPDHTTYVSGSASSGGVYDSTAKVVRWTFAKLQPGDSGTLSFKVKVD